MTNESITAPNGNTLPSSADQYNTVKDLIENVEMNKGDVWFVVSFRWYSKWEKELKAHIQDSSSSTQEQVIEAIGPIDNSDLFQDGEKEPLRKYLVQSDYIVVPKQAWELLVSWYGVKSPTTPITRKVILEGYQQYARVEVVLLNIQFIFKSANAPSQEASPVYGYFSKYEALGTLKNFACQAFGVPNDSTTQLRNEVDNLALTDMNATLHEKMISEGQTIILEQLDEFGNPPGFRTVTTRSQALKQQTVSSSSSVLSPYNTRSSGSMGSHYGLVGLNNLGNTCFMNSGLQCLSNTVELSKYFLDDEAEKDINRVNPLGTGGELAVQYGDLIKAIWSGSQSSVAPRLFKHKLSMFAPQFSGYQQHDSQELLAFLLDGLHEDLNRIQKKPYIEIKDADGRPDKEVADEMWANHLRRNDSIIVDLFQGQLKSTLVCPECSKVSVTFDPFMYMSLPLPIEKSKTIKVTFVPKDPNRPMIAAYAKVSKTSPVSELRKTVGELVHTPPSNILIVDIFNGKVYNRLDDHDSCGDILERDDIFGYEVDTLQRNHEEITNVCFHHFDIKSFTPRCFAFPVIESLPRAGVTGKELYDIVVKKTSRYTKRDETYSASSSENPDSMDTSDDSEPKEESEDQFSDYIFKLVRLSSKGERFHSSSYIIPNDELVTWESGMFGIDWNLKTNAIFNDEEHRRHEVVSSPEAAKKDSISLHECLQLFLKEEKLGEEDPWYCPGCKKHQRASKKFDLWKTPKILVVHLKRFSYTRWNRDKLDILIDFPIRNLNLSEYVRGPMDSPAVYDLYAVSNHYGGMGGGHYTAYAYNQPSARWYNFDDSHVSPANEREIKSRAAYVLFYRRRDADTPLPSEINNEPEPMDED